MKVKADIDNWAEDFVDAIKWGPFVFTSSLDPRKEWLESFKKEIAAHCQLPDDNYQTLRGILQELMEDGSFCPNQKILVPRFLGPKAAFKKVLKDAIIKDHRFSQQCQGLSVVSDHSREAKEVNSQSGQAQNKTKRVREE